MSSPQAFLLENNVFPTTEPNRVHYRFSYAEAPDSFVGPHYYYHDDHWIKTPIPDGTEPTDEQWWNIFPEAAIDTYVAISDGLRLLLGARCMVNTVPILGEQVDRTVDDVWNTGYKRPSLTNRGAGCRGRPRGKKSANFRVRL